MATPVSWPTLVFSTRCFCPASQEILQLLHFRSGLPCSPSLSLLPPVRSLVGVRTRPAYRLSSSREEAPLPGHASRLARRLKESPGLFLKSGNARWWERLVAIKRTGTDFEGAPYRFLTVCIIFPDSPVAAPTPTSWRNEFGGNDGGGRMSLSFFFFSSFSCFSLFLVSSSLRSPSASAKSSSIAVVKKELSSLGARCGARLYDHP